MSCLNKQKNEKLSTLFRRFLHSFELVFKFDTPELSNIDQEEKSVDFFYPVVVDWEQYLFWNRNVTHSIHAVTAASDVVIVVWFCVLSLGFRVVRVLFLEFWKTRICILAIYVVVLTLFFLCPQCKVKQWPVNGVLMGKHCHLLTLIGTCYIVL